MFTITGSGVQLHRITQTTAGDNRTKIQEGLDRIAETMPNLTMNHFRPPSRKLLSGGKIDHSADITAKHERTTTGASTSKARRTTTKRPEDGKDGEPGEPGEPGGYDR